MSPIEPRPPIFAPEQKGNPDDRVMIKHISLDHKYVILDNAQIDGHTLDELGNLHIRVRKGTK